MIRRLEKHIFINYHACMEIYAQIKRIIESGQKAVLVTITNTTGSSPGKIGFKLLVTEKGALLGTVGGGAIENLAIQEARECLRSGQSKSLSVNLSDIDMECGGKTDLFFEYLAGRQNFVLFGGGHVDQALSRILTILGYNVHVYDNRKEAVESLAGLENIHPLLGDYEDISPMTEILDNADFCFIATHGHSYDYTVLRQVLATGRKFRYVGLIGSARKVKITLKKIEESGVPVSDFVYSPAGLDIGGDSSAEIAVSIAAEVVAVTRASDAPHMRDRLNKL